MMHFLENQLNEFIEIITHADDNIYKGGEIVYNRISDKVKKVEKIYNKVDDLIEDTIDTGVDTIVGGIDII